MGHCVFLHRSDSIYDDSPAERYQFPAVYLERARTCIKDWIVYLEPVKVRHSRGYFATAKVADIIPDPSVPSMYVALIEPGSYLPFPRPIPFREDGKWIEAGLLNNAGKLSGRAQAAIRLLDASDFARIIERGLREDVDLLPRDSVYTTPGMEDEQKPFMHEQSRVRVEALVSRTLRDRVFRSVVLKAYDERCSVTGLKLINGGGRAEVDAAHIRPVKENGPDVINNGIALSGTAHWMFDRGLISLADDLTIMISRHVNDPDAVRAFVNRSGIALAPARKQDRPYPAFLKWHRENCFKQ